MEGKFVVMIIDPVTGLPEYGDIETTRSHAQRWANEYIRDGIIAGACPAKLASLYRQKERSTK